VEKARAPKRQIKVHGTASISPASRHTAVAAAARLADRCARGSTAAFTRLVVGFERVIDHGKSMTRVFAPV